MAEINSQAEKLNILLKEKVPTFYSFLSNTGKKIYFPSTGIMAQAAEAKKADINASIGIALDDSADALCLSGIASKVNLSKKEVFTYSSSFGNTNLREAWKRKILEKNPSLTSENFTMPVLTCGLTHGLSLVVKMFCDNDSEILLPNLFWGNYRLIAEVYEEAKLVPFSFFNSELTGFNFSAFRDELEKRNKTILLLNFPNNPTGYTITKSEQDELVSMLLDFANNGKEILVICDDAYFGLFFEENVAKESLFSKLAGLHSNVVAVKVDGPTKEEYVWGLRLGSIVVGNKDMDLNSAKAIEDKLGGLVRSSISNTSNLSQNLLMCGFESEAYESDKQAAYDLLKGRYLAVKNWLDMNLDHKKYFEALPFNSGYFMCVRLNNALSSEKVRQGLLNEHSIGVISIANDNLIRIAFSCLPKEKIPVVFDALVKVCEGYQ